MTTNKIKKLRGYVSFSQLGTFQKCPQQYKLMYLDGLRKKDESIEAFMGKMVHKALEWLYLELRNREYVRIDEIFHSFDAIWAKNWHSNIFIANKYQTTDDYYAVGKRCIANYFSAKGPFFLRAEGNYKVLHTEHRIDGMLENFKFRGILDRVDQLDDTIHLFDYKTSSRQKGVRALKNDLQLGLYHLLLSEEKQSENIIVHWVFLRNYSDVSLAHTPESLGKIKNKLLEQTKELQTCINATKEFPAKPGMLCNYCYLWESCEAKGYPNSIRRAR